MSRRFRRRWARTLLPAFLVGALISLRVWQTLWVPHSPAVLREGVYTVERVVDGDTLLLTNGARIRLRAMDTPETVQPNHRVEPWGPEASAFTKHFITRGPIRLQFDRERKDRHGRFLAYVWIDDRMLNEELVRAGLARVVPESRPAPAMGRRLLHAEKEAQAAHRGIWSR